MATHEIVSSIDAYIARLKLARETLASLYIKSEATKRKRRTGSSQAEPRSIQVPVPPPSRLQAAIQILPARMRHRRQYLKKPASPAFTALGGAVPEGPVVIRSSELTRMRSELGQPLSTISAPRPTASSSALEELAQEVAKRLGRE